MKKHLLNLVRIIVPIAMMGYLIWLLLGNPASLDIVVNAFSGQTEWGSIFVAFLLALASLSLTFIRWYLLAVSLGLKLRLGDAFRFGFLSYLLNFVGVGGVGGDVYKAYILAKENQGRRTEAVSTVVMDRAVGLYALFVVTAVATLGLNFQELEPVIRTICVVVNVTTVTGGVLFLATIISPKLVFGRIRPFLEALPKIGDTVKRAFSALGIYRRRPKLLVVIAIMSLAVHTLSSLAVYCLAKAFFPVHPTIVEMLVITPLALLVAALPLAPGGMGTLEAALVSLYVSLPAKEMNEASAITVALAYRVLTILLGFVGALFYLANRSSFQQAVHEAMAKEQDLERTPEPVVASDAPSIE